MPMKKIFNYILIVLIVCLIIWASFWLYEYSLKTQPVSAENGNVSGYAWSSNIGLISFSGSNYGVNIDSNGKFSGYAQSNSIGWISFNESDTDIPLSNDPCADDSCIAKATPSGQLGKSDVAIYGWARACGIPPEGSEIQCGGDGWDGWIRFDHGQANEVYVDANGEFHGWAWGGDVIGWISFNCADASESYPFICDSEGGDICEANEYCPREIWNVISDSCCSVTCILKTCAEQAGDICEANENCPGTIIPAEDTDYCCNATCVLKTCAEQDGDICGANQYCPGTIISASDTDSCCDERCRLEREEPERPRR